MSAVLALYRADDLYEHREALCEWLKANDVDPHTVAMRWISVEGDGGQRSIRYRTFRTTATGSRLMDPDDPAQAWTEERVAPLRTDLPKIGNGL